VYSLTDASKSFRQGQRTIAALRSVSLEIADGEFVAIQGPTGGGKSTLLQLLGALDRPSSGSVRLGDTELSTADERALARLRAGSIGFVFQNFNLIPTLTALENVQMALVPHRVDVARSRARAAEALGWVGLGARLDHRPAELSGGQQQRVAIARAIVTSPAVLLADEPTGNLDEAMRDEILSLLEGMWRERGLTMIVVTHDSAVAHRAQRRLHLKDGIVHERRPAA